MHFYGQLNSGFFFGLLLLIFISHELLWLALTLKESNRSIFLVSFVSVCGFDYIETDCVLVKYMNNIVNQWCYWPKVFPPEDVWCPVRCVRGHPPPLPLIFLISRNQFGAIWWKKRDLFDKIFVGCTYMSLSLNECEFP